MVERFRKYLNNEWVGVVRTTQVEEVIEELLSNLVDKFEELIAKGFSEDKAFVESIKSIGDLDEIVSQFKKPDNILITRQDINTLLYRNKLDEDYIYDKTFTKFKKLNIITLVMASFHFFLFLLIYNISQYNIILSLGLTVLCTSVALIIYYFNCQNFQTVLNNLLDSYKSIEYYKKGIKYLSICHSVFFSIILWSYIIIYLYHNSWIYRFDHDMRTVNQMKMLILFTLGILVSFIITVINNLYLRRKLSNNNLIVISKRRPTIFYLYHYGYLPITLVLLFINENYNNIIALALLLSLIVVSEVFVIIKEKSLITTRIMTILYALLYGVFIYGTFELGLSGSYDSQKSKLFYEFQYTFKDIAVYGCIIIPVIIGYYLFNSKSFPIWKVKCLLTKLVSSFLYTILITYCIFSWHERTLPPYTSPNYVLYFEVTALRVIEIYIILDLILRVMRIKLIDNAKE